VLAKRVTLFLGFLVVGCSYSVLRVQAATEGMFTADQAKRGNDVYQAQCVVCHGGDLDGIGQAPPLSGDEFLSKYQGESIIALFDKIHTSMPATSPGSLTRPQTADVLSYILSSNKYIAGAVELPSDEDALKKIQFVKP
jgi:mono/diheme cytochrome c family protein